MFVRTATYLAALLLALVACQSTSISIDEAHSRPLDAVALDALLDVHDWFELREQLAEMSDDDTSLRAYFDARCASAFNDCEQSNVHAFRALSDASLDIERAIDLRRLLPFNAMRLTHWLEAYSSTAEVIERHSDVLGQGDLENTENLLTIFRALRDVPPRIAEVQGDFVLTPNDKGRVPLTVDGTELHFIVDTGANFSVMMRSVAESTGLRIRPAGISVGTVTGDQMTADLAVADEVWIGQARLRNVPFLVFPDELLTFPGGVTIDGLIGFGELEAFGEIRFLAGGAFGVSVSPQPRDERNLALDGLNPVVRFECLGAPSIGHLDTGADATVFYEPFLRLHRSHIESTAVESIDKMGGVGSVVEIPSWRLPSLDLMIGGQMVSLKEPDVYRDSLPTVDHGRLHANLGRDLFDQFDEVILDFRSMSVVLR